MESISMSVIQWLTYFWQKPLEQAFFIKGLCPQTVDKTGVDFSFNSFGELIAT